jgi:hypothetical protein
MRSTSLSRIDSEWWRRARARIELGHASQAHTHSLLERDVPHGWPVPDSDADAIMGLRSELGPIVPERLGNDVT